MHCVCSDREGVLLRRHVRRSGRADGRAGAHGCWRWGASGEGILSQAPRPVRYTSYMACHSVVTAMGRIRRRYILLGAPPVRYTLCSTIYVAYHIAGMAVCICAPFTVSDTSVYVWRTSPGRLPPTKDKSKKEKSKKDQSKKDQPKKDKKDKPKKDKEKRGKKKSKDKDKDKSRTPGDCTRSPPCHCTICISRASNREGCAICPQTSFEIRRTYMVRILTGRGVAIPTPLPYATPQIHTACTHREGRVCVCGLEQAALAGTISPPPRTHSPPSRCRCPCTRPPCTLHRSNSGCFDKGRTFMGCP